jgi:diadenosine tetraphosphate (Ap4A) HIT family hydrolase
MSSGLVPDRDSYIRPSYSIKETQLTSSECPFCARFSDRVFYNGKGVFGIWDGHPVSPGHALLIPRRHCETWFAASADEQAELASAIEFARDSIPDEYSPDGFNIGVNVGAAAGQTVRHLQVHVIPRYSGDVADPTDGVRGVIPQNADYLKDARIRAFDSGLPHVRVVVTGGDDLLLPHIRAHVDRADAVDVAVAFTTGNGLRAIFEHLRDLLARGGRVRFLTGDYLLLL